MTHWIDPELLNAFDSQFKDYFEKGRSPGLIYGLAERGNLIHWKAMGEGKIGEEPIGRGSAFRVASITKSFTAMSVLMLRDEGLLNLDAPFVTYIPELFPQQIEVFEVTVRQLLTMSAGFPTDNEWADRVESITDSEFLHLLTLGFRFDSRPGSRFEYSNLGYALLARIVANVSKKSFIEYVTEEIFFALGLRNTTFNFAESAHLVNGYAHINGWMEEPHQHPGAFSSIGGVITTLDDLVAWSHYLSSAFNPEEPELGPLKKSSRREMQNIGQVIPTRYGAPIFTDYKGVIGYGFGLRVEESVQFGKLAGHTGGYPGFGSHMVWHVDTGLSVIALANGRYADPVEVTTPALKSLLIHKPHEEKKISKELEFIREITVNLIVNLDEQLMDTYFAINMDLDIPREIRKFQIRAALSESGNLSENFHIVSNNNTSHLHWIQKGNKKDLDIEIWLAPLAPLQIQVLKVSAVDFLDTSLNEG